jgi:MFS family permease
VAIHSVISSPLWRNRNFTALWVGQTISMVGTRVNLFVVPTLAIIVLHATPAEVGLLNTVATAPYIVISLIAGVAADRMPRRTVMIACDLARVALVGAIPLLAAVHLLGLPALYALVLLASCATIFFDVCYRAYLPDLIAQDQLADGNAKLQLSTSGSVVLGPSIAGALVQAFGAAQTLLLDAASFAVSALSLSILPSPRAHAAGERSARGALRDIGQGLRVVWDSPTLRLITIVTAFINLGNAMVLATVLLFAYRDLRLDPGQVGLAVGIGSLGFVLGALVTPWLIARLGFTRSLLLCSVAFVVGFGAIPAGLLFGGPFVLGAGYFIFYFAFPVYNTNVITVIQSRTPADLLGRVMATVTWVTWSTLSVGAILGGGLGGAIGLAPVILIGAAIMGLGALMVVLRRDLEPEPAATAAG